MSGRHRGIASLVFSHRGSASQRISAARTRIARIFASHRIARIAAHIALSLYCAHCVFHENAYFLWILWKIMRRNAIFQAISDISEPVWGDITIFVGKAGHFGFKQSPKALDFSRTFIFPGIFLEVMNKNLFPWGFLFCNFEPFSEKASPQNPYFLVYF